MRILVAMSGGVDSSTVAHLLTEQGHDVIGVRFTLWNDPLAPAVTRILPTKCCNTQSIARAKTVTEKLGIPLLMLDLQEEFKREVVDPFLEGYRSGITPNPCVHCNRFFKHRYLLECADENGCDMVATGHYARIAREEMPDGTHRCSLLEAVDTEKDQSYFLYRLTQEQLARTLFPLGTMHKSEVYALAQKFGVPLEKQSYRESQNICFFPEKSPKEFLMRYLKNALIPGQIVRKDGTVVGMHKGLPLYTVGQRRIGVGGLSIPLEVVAKDTKENRLLVEEPNKTHCTSIGLRDIHWIATPPQEKSPIPFECRVRSLSARVPGSLTYRGDRGNFVFSSP
ncbi:MAG: tRNA 2-thiouridine(34) synthase MnmA, partial [Candidatus Peribacteraceae bacterium]